MATRHISFRIEDETFERLESQSRRSGQTRSHLAKTLLEEGLRMESHPGITFRSGPAGRRAGLANGPDVWEIVSVWRGVEASGDDALRQTAELTGLTPAQVRTALGYYSEFRSEVDDWIKRVSEEATQAEDTWHRSHALLEA